MIDFRHVPVHTLIINQLVKLDYEEFVDRVFRVNFNGVVKYVDGIIMIHFSAPETIETVKEEIDGTYHWSYVEFAKCKKFEKQLVRNGNHNITLQVVDVSENEIFADFAKWVKLHEIWKDEK